MILILLCFSDKFEYYSNKNKFLYPTKGLFCENKNLEKAYGPQVCCIDGKNCNYVKNCRCVDKNTGLCKICYNNVNLSSII